jgi:hypothetical protein
MSTILPRWTDTGYRAWADGQSDCWVRDEVEEDNIPQLIEECWGEGTQLALFAEVDELALELCESEGLPFSTAVVEAGRRMLGLRLFAQDWDRHAWLGGNEGAKAF